MWVGLADGCEWGGGGAFCANITALALDIDMQMNKRKQIIGVCLCRVVFPGQAWHFGDGVDCVYMWLYKGGCRVRGLLNDGVLLGGFEVGMLGGLSA